MSDTEVYVLIEYRLEGFWGDFVDVAIAGVYYNKEDADNEKQRLEELHKDDFISSYTRYRIDKASLR